MASRTSRREWVRGLSWAFGVGRYDRKQIHSVSERSVGYGFLIGEGVQNHPNPHLYQTGSQSKRGAASIHASSWKGCSPIFISCARVVGSPCPFLTIPSSPAAPKQAQATR